MLHLFTIIVHGLNTLYIYIDMIETQTKCLLYGLILLLVLSYLKQVNGRVVEEYGKLKGIAY